VIRAYLYLAMEDKIGSFLDACNWNWRFSKHIYIWPLHELVMNPRNNMLEFCQGLVSSSWKNILWNYFGCTSQGVTCFLKFFPRKPHFLWKKLPKILLCWFVYNLPSKVHNNKVKIKTTNDVENVKNPLQIATIIKKFQHLWLNKINFSSKGLGKDSCTRLASHPQCM